MVEQRPAREEFREKLTVDKQPARNKSWLPRASTLLLVSSGPFAWAATRVLGESAPDFVESVYGGAVGAAAGGALARATGWIGFSVAEWMLLGFVVVQGARLLRPFTGRRRPARARPKAAASAVLRVVRDCSVAVAVFYLVWGLHYARPRLPDRAEWPELRADATLLERLAEQQILLANLNYRILHAGTDDAGTVTTLDDRRQLDSALDTAWRAVSVEMDLPASAATPRGPVKYLLVSPLLHRLGLSGFYFPFTGEANVNASVPAVRRAHVMAHEKAHQRGVGPEDEANFLGWRVAATAEHPLANYAAAAFAQGQLLNTLARSDPERADELRAELLPGVRRDLDDVRVYWSRHRGPARDLTRRVNHAYLRGNRVEGGVESYGRSARLLVRFAQLRGGDLAAGASDSAASVPSSRP